MGKDDLAVMVLGKERGGQEGLKEGVVWVCPSLLQYYFVLIFLIFCLYKERI
jgi:hypothetical protein